jgi:UMF1 family MFS transporter
MPKNLKQILSWSLYDWANSAFATTVMAGFFPLFFKKYWSLGVEATKSTFQLGLANSLEGILVAIVAPVLGAMADKADAKKKLLFFFAFLGVVMTACLFIVSQGQWVWALVIYVLASLGFSCGNIFYDALLVNVAKEREFDFVSSLGYALGYLGGGLLFAINVFMVLNPVFFHIASSAEAIRISFLSVAIWWAVFSLPIFLFVKETPSQKSVLNFVLIKASFKELGHTLKNIKAEKNIFIFLLAYWFYIDGIDTIIKMAIDYGLALGFAEQSLIVALLLVQFIGFPAAILFGLLGQKFGAKKGIYLALFVYIGITIWSYFLKSTWEFYGIAVAIGLVQGGVQALSRSYYVSLIPKTKAAEFLGFYNMFGKFAVIIGPALMGTVAIFTHNSRASVLAIMFLLIIGTTILSFVKPQKI